MLLGSFYLPHMAYLLYTHFALFLLKRELSSYEYLCLSKMLKSRDYELRYNSFNNYKKHVNFTPSQPHAQNAHGWPTQHFRSSYCLRNEATAQRH